MASMSRRSLPAVKAGEPIARRHMTARTSLSLMISAQAQRAGAVSDAVTLNSKIREQGQMQVRQRCFFRIFDMPSAFERAGASACQDQRNIPRIVRVALAHSRSIYQCRMIQQRALAVLSRLHLLQQVRKLHHMIRIDLFDLSDLRRLT